MRDPDRIPKILYQIGEAWKKCPDLRLCQLIYIATGGGDSFYIEDEHLILMIDNFSAKGE